MKILGKSLGLLAFVAISTLAIGQNNFKNVRIDKYKKGDDYGPCEPSIRMDPNNPDRVVAGSVLDRVYYSENGGKKWKKNILTSDYGVFGDPVIGTDKGGNFYYLHLSNPAGKGWSDPSLLDRIVIQRSGDGGKSWTPGSFAGNRHPKDQDKHWFIDDPKSGKLHVTWTEFDKYDSKATSDKSRILYSSSSDMGETWTDATAISDEEGDCLDDDMTTEGAVPAVGPNGEVYVAWSFDGKIYFDKSMDGGKTWGQDKVVAEQPGGWTFDISGIGRANGMPFTVCDLSSGPNRGTIYVNWADQRNGEKDTDIWISSSKDGGDTWTQPKRVNDDKTKTQQFFTCIAIDQSTGYLYIVFYDRRDFTDDHTHVYMAVSNDGGNYFSNTRVSKKPFLPNPEVFFGDYNDITAVKGHVRPIWTQLNKGKLSVWTALINVQGIY